MVGATSGYTVAVRRETSGINGIRMPQKHSRFLAVFDVPNLNIGVISSAGRECAAAWRERDKSAVRNAIVEHSHLLKIGSAYQLKTTGRCGSNPIAIAREPNGKVVTIRVVERT